jgi:predicted nucleic-acid-binding Zn-ribbon protein
MKSCTKCGFEGTKEKYCPECGEKLREVIYKDKDETFVEVTKEDNVIAEGFHVVCKGLVSKNKSSSHKSVLTCGKCALRVYETKEVESEVKDGETGSLRSQV